MLEDFHPDFLANLHHFRRVSHAAPGKIGDVEEAVHPSQVDKDSVLGNILDLPHQFGALHQTLRQLTLAASEILLKRQLPADHHIVAFAVDLDDLAGNFLALQGVKVAVRPGISMRGREERWNPNINGQTAFDAAHDPPGN